MLVTVIDIVLALPIAFYMAKIAKAALARAARRGGARAAVGQLSRQGVRVAQHPRQAGRAARCDLVAARPGYGQVALVIVLAYLWLPFMIIPIYAGLERLPDSLLEASSDLGARFGSTFRRVVFPMLLPSIVAGSVFTFSLTLGDYIAVGLVGGKTQMIGSIVYSNFAANLPLASAYAVVPVLIMIVYLLWIRRTGALENL